MQSSGLRRLNKKSSLQSVTSLPEGFPSDKHLPKLLNLLDTSKSDGFNSLIGIDDIVRKVDVSVRDMAVGSQYGIPVVLLEMKISTILSVHVWYVKLSYITFLI